MNPRPFFCPKKIGRKIHYAAANIIIILCRQLIYDRTIRVQLSFALRFNQHELFRYANEPTMF